MKFFKDLAYLLLVFASVPFTIVEAACLRRVPPS